jgi:hypothetical protein
MNVIVSELLRCLIRRRTELKEYFDFPKRRTGKRRRVASNLPVEGSRQHSRMQAKGTL